MGRIVPYDNANNSLIVSFLYFSFSFVALASSIAIILTLCGVGSRRRKCPATPQPQLHTLSNPLEVKETMKNSSTSPTPTPNTQETTNPNATIFISQEQPCTSETTTTKLEKTLEGNNNNEMLMKELPLPPSMKQANNIDSEFVKRVTSERRLSFSLSMKIPRSLSLAKNCNKKEENDIAKKEKIKGDESVWMKTIILGEKCMPDEEEDGVIYDGKGKKISAYHPRTSVSSTSNSLSRQWSSIALDVPQSHEDRISKI